LPEPFVCAFCEPKRKFDTYFQLIEHYESEHNGMRPENR
jgi:hypothetical protein